MGFCMREDNGMGGQALGKEGRGMGWRVREDTGGGEAIREDNGGGGMGWRMREDTGRGCCGRGERWVPASARTRRGAWENEKGGCCIRVREGGYSRE